MRAFRTALAITAVALTALLLTHPSPGKGRAVTPEVVRIGIAGSLFRDAPEPLVMILMEPFGALMEAQTGLKGRLQAAGCAYEMGKKLTQNDLDLGVFQGIEYAWAEQKYPELHPLMIVDNNDTHPRAYLAVRSADNISRFAQLRGKVLAMPKFNHEHCYQLMEKRCREIGASPERFFAKMVKPETAEDALDDLGDGKLGAAIIEGFPLKCYERRKPGRFSKLKVLAESEVFPSSVVVCHEGALSPEIIRQFREGMLNAQQTQIGRQLMTMWKVNGFLPVPADYQTICTNIVKDYPPPKQAYK